MAQQTAVDFAVEKLEKLIPIGNQILIGIILEKAKEMEKEQIKEAHLNGQSEWDIQSLGDTQKKLSEQYYNETYVKK